MQGQILTPLSLSLVAPEGSHCRSCPDMLAHRGTAWSPSLRIQQQLKFHPPCKEGPSTTEGTNFQAFRGRQGADEQPVSSKTAHMVFAAVSSLAGSTRLQPYRRRTMPKTAFSSAGCSSEGLPLPLSHTHVARAAKGTELTSAIPRLPSRALLLSPTAPQAASRSQRDQPSWTKPSSRLGSQEPCSPQPEERAHFKMSLLNPQSGN